MKVGPKSQLTATNNIEYVRRNLYWPGFKLAQTISLGFGARLISTYLNGKKTYDYLYLGRVLLRMNGQSRYKKVYSFYFKISLHFSARCKITNATPTKLY